MLKDMIALKEVIQKVCFDNVDINFDNLLTAWSQPNPKDYFYMKVFGKTFEQKQKDDEFDVSGYSDEDKNEKL